MGHRLNFALSTRHERNSCRLTSSWSGPFDRQAGPLPQPNLPVKGRSTLC